MSAKTINDFTPLLRQVIGSEIIVNRIIESLEQQSANQNYPPYNHIRYADGRIDVQLAVAGFSEGDLTVSVENGYLVITGEKEPTNHPDGTEYVHQGISSRRFRWQRPLGNFIEVIGAEVKNGILTVRMETVLPDSLKPRTIAITYTK